MAQIPDTPIPKRSQSTDAVMLLSGMNLKGIDSVEFSVYKCTHSFRGNQHLYCEQRRIDKSGGI